LGTIANDNGSHPCLVEENIHFSTDFYTENFYRIFMRSAVCH